jgi:hypothetical protein
MLAAGGTCQFFYAFTPVVAGPVTGGTSGSVNGEPFSFTFAGNGLPEPEGAALGLTACAALASLAGRRARGAARSRRRRAGGRLQGV